MADFETIGCSKNLFLHFLIAMIEGPSLCVMSVIWFILLFPVLIILDQIEELHLQLAVLSFCGDEKSVRASHTSSGHGGCLCQSCSPHKLTPGVTLTLWTAFFVLCFSSGQHVESLWPFLWSKHCRELGKQK